MDNLRRPIRVSLTPPTQPATPPQGESITSRLAFERGCRVQALRSAVDVWGSRRFGDMTFWGTVDAFQKYLADGTMTEPEES